MIDEDGTLTAWRMETEELWSELARLRAARDAATPGSVLHHRYQEEADRVSACWSAHRAAAPVLTELRERRHRAANEHALAEAEAHYDRLSRVRLAALTGLPGAVLLMITYYGTPPWWVLALGIVLVLACVCLLVAAAATSTGNVEHTGVGAIGERIDAIERAARYCISEDDLRDVERLLYPQPKSTTVTRIL
jgi:hypothetical protein